MSDKDKTWCKYKSGFFVLISNILDSPKSILAQYFGRTDIEVLFKTSKEYLRLLPLRKWNDKRVRGKILSDIISLIVYTWMLDVAGGSKYSMTEIPTRLKSLICSTDDSGTVRLDVPNKQVKEIFSMFGMKVPISFDLNVYRCQLYS